jgi:hypothetical protein
VLPVDVDDVLEMLRRKDRGDDPNNVMIDCLDEILIGIAP